MYQEDLGSHKCGQALTDQRPMQHPKYDYMSHQTWEAFKKKGWDKLVFKDILLVAEIFEERLGIHLYRDAKREKSYIFKWFDDNFDVIGPLLQYVQLIRE